MAIPQAEWHVKMTGGYARQSDEAFENAVRITKEFTDLGWTFNAVCGVLGNIEVESGYNAWRWQNDELVLSTETELIHSSAHGYGLFQFTPSSKYIESVEAQWSEDFGPFFIDLIGTSAVSELDGVSQIEFVNGYADYIPTQDYPMTYREFKDSMASPATLASVWLYNYERPGNPQGSIAIRQESANYWYNILSPYFGKKRGMPLWMMMRRRELF